MTSGHSRSSPIKWVLLLIVVAVGAGVFFLRPSGKPADAAADAKAKDAPVTQELAPSDVAVVHRQALVRKLPLSGSLTPLVQTNIKSKVSGEVLAIKVREGQAVRRGDVLVRIDTRNQTAQVASQQAGVEKAKADLALARLNNENNQRLLDKHFIAQNVLDTSTSVYAASAAGLKAAEAQLRLAQIGLQDAVVLAPIDGVVSRRSAEPGEKISPDSPLMSTGRVPVLSFVTPGAYWDVASGEGSVASGVGRRRGLVRKSPSATPAASARPIPSATETVTRPAATPWTASW